MQSRCKEIGQVFPHLQSQGQNLLHAVKDCAMWEEMAQSMRCYKSFEDGVDFANTNLVKHYIMGSESGY